MLLAASANTSTNGTDIIVAMLIVGLIFLGVILIGEFVRFSTHRRHDRHARPH